MLFKYYYYSLLLILVNAAALPNPYEFNLNINNNFNLNFRLNTDTDTDTDTDTTSTNTELSTFPPPSPPPSPSPQLPSSYYKNPRLFDLHKNLIEIQSISQNEFQISNYLQSYLKKYNFKIQLIPSENGCNNLYIYNDKLNSSKILLTSHFDTVPPFIKYSIKNNDEIYGRGSNDAKGSIATQIISVLELIESGEIQRQDLSMLFVHSEEIGGIGMRDSSDYLIDNLKINWNTVIFGEPTENKLAVGHKGIYYFNLNLIGKSSHSGYPELGIDANNELIKIMYELSTIDWPVDNLLGDTTINVGLINGGTAANVISPYSNCTILMRTSVNYDIIDEKINSILNKYIENEKCDLQFEILQKANPTFLNYNVNGFDTVIAKYSTDIPNLKNTGYKRYLYGPGSITVAHGDNEFVSADSLLQAVDDLKKLIRYSI